MQNKNVTFKDFGEKKKQFMTSGREVNKINAENIIPQQPNFEIAVQ